MGLMIWVQFLAMQDFSLLHSVQTELGSTQPPIQWVLGALSLGLSGRGVKLTLNYTPLHCALH
jgi:hypothetical protein